MKKVALTLSLLATVSVQAQTVSLSYQDRTNSRPVDSSNNFLPNGSLVRIGTFTSGFDFTANAFNLTALNNAFTLFDSTTTITEGSSPNFRVGSINKTNVPIAVDLISGKQLYYWIFNASSEALATEHGIFTNLTASNWIGGDGSPTGASNSLTLSSATSGGTLVARIGSTIVNPNISGNTITTGKLAAIPEPSTYALMGLGLVVVGFMARRRK